ncbi:hypothetical protein GL218_05413 [Daldinia childiae]|uniref:uncharacterized protein n=1 Tax=Daldinia childiae TaxID=326645 RepID=UPI001445AA40|nr:uncharacterized protein GL218_05413 [Daldinia childiae]KAF3058137.1 hypothetical protein GL218_05413 [Daldinia childiae]
MMGVGSVSSSGDEPFHLEKYLPACEAAKAQEIDQIEKSLLPCASKSPHNEDTTHIRPTLTGTPSKKKHFLSNSIAALGRSKDKTSREEQTGFGIPSSLSQDRGYRRLSHNLVAKFKGIFNDDEVIGIAEEEMRPLSENPTSSPQPLKLHEPAQQSKVDLSRASSLRSIIYSYDRYGMLKVDNETRVDASNHNDRNSLETDTGFLSRRATMEGIIGRHNVNRDSALNQGGMRKMNDLEKAHNTPNLLQLNLQAIEAGYEDISDRLEYDPEWGGSIGHWLVDMASKQGESCPSSLLGDGLEFKDFDGAFLSSDNTSSERESIDSKELLEFTIEDGAVATHLSPNPTIPRTSVSTRAGSCDLNEDNLLPIIPRQEPVFTPQSQSEKSSSLLQQEIEHCNRGISEPGRTIEQANPTNPTYLSDWLCPHCGFLNLPRRTACLQCWEKRAEPLGNTGHRIRRVTFAEPTKFEGKHASAMDGYNASLVDASLIPEPLNIKSCLKTKTHQESKPVDKSTQTGVQGSGAPASHQNQHTNVTKATATSNETEQTDDKITITKEQLKRMEAIVKKTLENNETMRRMLKSMEEMYQHISKERNAKD